jgi:lysozyme
MTTEQIVIKHEGVRYTPYRDSRGILTVGCGFNLEAPDARQACEAAGIDYDAVCAGAAISANQVQKLFDHSMLQAQIGARHSCPQFDNLKQTAQQALVDMAYNMGAAKLSEFHGMLAALAEDPPDYHSAAAEMFDSDWRRELPTRACFDMQLMLQ